MELLKLADELYETRDYCVVRFEKLTILNAAKLPHSFDEDLETVDGFFSKEFVGFESKKTSGSAIYRTRICDSFCCLYKDFKSPSR